MARVARWRFLLFARGHAGPGEIEAMPFSSLRYWGTLAEIQFDAERRVVPGAASGA
jgi:hypothetical protein